MLRLAPMDIKSGDSRWSIVVGLNLVLAISVASIAQAQALPSDDDLFDSATSSEPAADSSQKASGANGVAAARLVRTVPEAKILYADRTRKIVYGCKLYSDDSRVYHGKYVEYYRNGREFCRGEYRDGRRHGKWTFLRMADGSLGKEGTYTDDKPNGKWVVLRSDGSTMREEMYKDGVSHGEWITYSVDGKTPLKKFQFVDGKQLSE